MGRKIFMIIVVVAAIVFSYVILFAIHPLFEETSAIAANATGAENMTGYLPAVNSFPLWGMFIPALVGIVAVVMIMRAPETPGR